ncbi:hypothetical protein BLTE_09790 [Blastochloris tepida]|uniref:Uncharacterized protein n=1 Tax=Blastochloris tepida TaxID=2233851 RepID=A0A348FYB1_9HYPH|nr:hypothetical protein BLTE_09790 [Blastochloris tepida]
MTDGGAVGPKQKVNGPPHPNGPGVEAFSSPAGRFFRWKTETVSGRSLRDTGNHMSRRDQVKARAIQ